MGVLRVFHKYFVSVSMSFPECPKTDSNVSVLCFKGAFECFFFFCQKRLTFV